MKRPYILFIILIVLIGCLITALYFDFNYQQYNYSPVRYSLKNRSYGDLTVSSILSVYDGDTFRIQNDADDVTFEVDYDSTVTPGNIAIEPTGSSTDFWNYLTASIKSNTGYDTITVTPLVDSNGFDYALFGFNDISLQVIE